MPKQKLTELQRRRELLRKNVKLLQGGRTNADMGEIIGKCANSYQNKMNRPDTQKGASHVAAKSKTESTPRP